MSNQQVGPSHSHALGASPGAPQGSSYAMGFTDRERKRLMQQGAIMREPTASTFRAAGITPGMRVLDLGSGAGDVAMLAADLVGPTGSVLGLDGDVDSVAWATRRVLEAGYTNVRFRAGEFNEFTTSSQFDALVGRFILMYLPNPVAILARLSPHLRSGGVIVFFEPDYTVLSSTIPDLPLFRQCEEWFVAVMRASGACLDMGMRLHKTYCEAGFAKAGCLVSHMSGCGVQPGLSLFYSETIRSILPRIAQYNIASPDEVDIDTLADRLESEVRAADPQWVGVRYIGAWAKQP